MNKKFKEKHFFVIKEAIDPKIANFIYNYFNMKRQVARTFFDTRYISPYTAEWGVWNDEQVPETYSHYSDIVMETLLEKLVEPMSKETELELIPTYSYARIYKKGDVLHRHKDRYSCEISTTVNLGGDPWPIYIENDPSKGGLKDGKYKSEMTEGKKVNLKPGDMLVYKGNLCEHWREAFEGEDCGQVFLHYNRKGSKSAKENALDKRPLLGLPGWFKGAKLTKSTK